MKKRIENILYIGSFYPQVFFSELVKEGITPDYPAQRFQISFLDSFVPLFKNSVLLSSPVVASYPAYKKLNIQSFGFTINENIKSYFSGFVNIPGIKMFSQANRLFWNIKKSIKKLGKENTCIVIYSVRSPFLVPAVLLARLYKINTCLIVPDLPQFMTEDKGGGYRFAKKLDWQIIKACVSRIDSFVLLCSYMKEKLPIDDKPYIVMEGVYNERMVINQESNYESEKKTILYTGRATKRYGLHFLIDAFKEIQAPNYSLLIRGNGMPSEEAERISAQDSRIVFLDQMSDEEIAILQRKSTVLVNPVVSSEPFTRYFFPSKTMEFLASGTPTIMCKLSCIPSDYYPYIFFVEEETTSGLKECIIKVCELPSEERRKRGEDARQFILKKKNSRVQAARVYSFLLTIV